MALNIKKDLGNTRRKPDLNSLVYGKIPPQAIELEEAVLGAIMLENDKMLEVFDIIPSGEAFYVDANQRIYNGIKTLFELGTPVDLMTVTQQMSKTDELEIIGGAYYLTKLTMSVVSSAHVEAHSRIVMEKYFARELIRISGNVIGEAYEDSTDVFDLVAQAESQIGRLVGDNISKQADSIRDVAVKSIREKEAQRNSEVTHTGITSGFKQLDELTAGWQKTDLIILAARPAVGKTAFTLNLGTNAAYDPHAPKSGVFFSLEMGKGQLYDRIASNKADIPHEWIKHPKRMNEDQFKKYIEVSQQLSRSANGPIFIDDSANLTSIQLRAKAYKLKRNFDIQWIMIDYLQLMRGNVMRNGNREGEISQISRELKGMAKELEVPVIALSQLNRGVESRSNNIPKLSDLRESGAIEQDADIVMFLYGAAMEEAAIGYNSMTDQDVVCLVAKNRAGATGDMLFKFQKNYQRFVEPEDKNPFMDQPMVPNPMAGIRKDPSEFGGSKMFIPGGYQTRSPQAPGNGANDDAPF